MASNEFQELPKRYRPKELPYDFLGGLWINFQRLIWLTITLLFLVYPYTMIPLFLTFTEISAYLFTIFPVLAVDFLIFFATFGRVPLGEFVRQNQAFWGWNTNLHWIATLCCRLWSLLFYFYKGISLSNLDIGSEEEEEITTFQNLESIDIEEIESETD